MSATRRNRAMTALLLLIGSSGAAPAQFPINGPMPGYTDLMSTTIWMQCKGPCQASLAYWPQEHPDSTLATAAQTSDAALAHVLKFTINDLKPGTTYGYRVLLDGKAVDAGQPLMFRTQALWRYRTEPPAFKVATGSCAYINEAVYDRPGEPYGGEYGIFDAIADKSPDLMLWLGDNIYLREPDWGSWGGIVRRYTLTRALPDMQRLLRGTQHLAIWDDHDFGPNDADNDFINAPLTRKAFDLFWANPTSGAPGVDGITTMFQYGDIDFFLMDDRTFRTPSNLKTETPTLLGAAQIDWLIRALKNSGAPFKVVALGSQFLNTAAVYENYATYPQERQRIIDRIDQEGISGVIFLTGDRHFTQMSELKLADGRSIWDLTVSPFTSGVYKSKEENKLLVPGTLVEQRNFATLEFSGPRKARVMKISVFDSKGGALWERSIAQPHD